MAKILCPSIESLQEAEHVEEYNSRGGTNLPIGESILANDMLVCNCKPL